MKTFITINGLECRITERESMERAIESAENICDHSKEIIVREIDYNKLVDHVHVFENDPVKQVILPAMLEELEEINKSLMNSLKDLYNSFPKGGANSHESVKACNQAKYLINKLK